MGIFSQTAGSTCEFWVNPVNFTFRCAGDPHSDDDQNMGGVAPGLGRIAASGCRSSTHAYHINRSEVKPDLNTKSALANLKVSPLQSALKIKL
jgi:hypothetical protein